VKMRHDYFSEVAYWRFVFNVISAYAPQICLNESINKQFWE
jgi:hypothetical protein